MRISSKALPAVLAAAALVLAGCSALDVVGKTAVTTFKALADKEASAIALDGATGRWVLTSPGGERFEWSSDFAGAGPDFLLSLGARPYQEAGLDPARLPADRFSFDPATGRLSLAFDFGDKGSSAASPVESFTSIVKAWRPRVGYHAARISTWVFANVPVKDAAGKDVQVDKFLRPYDLP